LGRRNILEELYLKYSNIIYKYLLGLSHDEDLAEDLMQDVFCSSILTIKNCPDDVDALQWLYSVAKRKWIDYLRKQNKSKNISLDEQNLEIKYYENFDKNIEKQRLYRAIANLDEKSSKVFLIKNNSNLTFKELGELFDKSESWAKVTYFRAKNKIKEVLENEDK
jgi:RNA polymerase sigma-70 factor (ECF subfamily)